MNKVIVYANRVFRALKGEVAIPSGVFTAKHFKHDPKTGLILPEPYMVRSAKNAYTNVGGVALLNLLIGAGGTVFDATHAYIGVGDSSTATLAAHTDLQATLASTIAIVSSTNATPIVLTVTSHGYSNGDTITVAGHTTNTAANGTWIIAGVTTNTFNLVNSVGNGVGGATGTVAKGNRMRVAMDATYPSLSSQTMTWQATLGPGVAEWGTGIQESALFNSFITSATMLDRVAQNLGVKGASTTLKIQIDIHVP